jgi:hypothetical protein
VRTCMVTTSPTERPRVAVRRRRKKERAVSEGRRKETSRGTAGRGDEAETLRADRERTEVRCGEALGSRVGLREDGKEGREVGGGGDFGDARVGDCEEETVIGRGEVISVYGASREGKREGQRTRGNGRKRKTHPECRRHHAEA